MVDMVDMIDVVDVLNQLLHQKSLATNNLCCKY